MVMGEEAGWGAEASMDDLNWIIASMKRLDKIAVVSKSEDWKWLSGIDSQFVQLVTMGKKHYEPSRIADAWTWLRG